MQSKSLLYVLVNQRKLDWATNQVSSGFFLNSTSPVPLSPLFEVRIFPKSFIRALPCEVRNRVGLGDKLKVRDLSNFDLACARFFNSSRPVLDLFLAFRCERICVPFQFDLLLGGFSRKMSLRPLVGWSRQRY